MFSVPCSSISEQNLDDLLLAFGPIWKKADALLVNSLIGFNDLYLLKDEAVALDQGFSRWQETQTNDFRPRAVGYVTQEQAGSSLRVGCWPGRVDAYFDLYVAGVWNTSRIA